MTKDFPKSFQNHCNAIITGVWCSLYTSYRHINDVHWIVYHDRRKIKCSTIDSFRDVWIRFRNRRMRIDGIEMRITVYDNRFGRTWESITDVTELFDNF